MAIGTLAAVGLGLAGAGSIIGGISSNKAANKAAQTAQNTADQNNALAQYIYGQNQQTLNPYVQRGNAAGNQINALLGLGGGTTNSAGSAFVPGGAQAQPSPGYQAGYGEGGLSPSIMGLGMYVPDQQLRDPMSYYGQDMISVNGGSPYGLSGNPTVPAVAGQGTTAAPQTAQQAASDAFNIFKNSTGYQFRVNEGTNALNSGYAGSGLLQSGAALRALDDYRQNMASNEFGNYMAYLGNQQGVGLSGASAVAGVGQNYANSVMQNNNNASSAAANAALYKGANNPFSNALGMIGGGLFGMR